MELAELVAVSDVYVDNVGGVEIIGQGQNVRVIYYTWQGTGTNRQAVVVAKIVMPMNAVNRGTISRMLTEQIRISDGNLEAATH
jgi:hypothetical protein